MSTQSKKRRRLSDASTSNEPSPKKPKCDVTEDENDNDKTQELMMKELIHQRSQIKHLNPKQKILLLGEGDFSFAASLSRLGFCNLIATSLEDYKTVIKTHYNSKYNIQLIKRMKNKIFHNIDITQIDQHKHFKSLSEESKFDIIIFNFPHSGIANYEYQKSIPSNQQLLRSIFEQSSNLLKQNGELHIALKSEPIYNSWDIQKQCNDANNDNAFKLKLKNRIKFEAEKYFGYQHKTTTSHKQSVSSNESYIWIFGMYIDNDTMDWTPIELDVGTKFSVGMYKCKTCHQSYNSQKRYEMHMQSKKHKETKAKINLKGKNKGNNNYYQNNKIKRKKMTTFNKSGKRRF